MTPEPNYLEAYKIIFHAVDRNVYVYDEDTVGGREMAAEAAAFDLLKRFDLISKTGA